MNNKKYYAIGILIALVLCRACSWFCSTINVIAQFAAGFRSWSEYSENMSIAAAIFLAIKGIAAHFFTGWLTAKILGKYANKNGCLTLWFFRSAAIALVLYTLIIVTFIFPKSHGWLTFLVHVLSLLLFGKKIYKQSQTIAAMEQTDNQYNNSGATLLQSQQSMQATGETVNPAAGNNTFCFCHKCGTKLTKNTNFCHKCGAKINIYQ